MPQHIGLKMTTGLPQHRAVLTAMCLVLGTTWIANGSCPEQCTCDADIMGRKRVRCFRGGLEGTPPVASMDEDTRVFIVTAPPNNSNNLTIGRIFTRLRHLQEIHITNSFVPAIGDNTFWDLEELLVLNLTRNSIAQLREKNFNGLKKLEKLHLDYNSITEMPSATFQQMPNLRNLTLSHNKLSKLVARMFLEIHRLEHLDLSWNPISEIGIEDFKELTQLRRLYLSHCELNKFEAVMVRSTTELEVLDLSHNQIEFVGPEEFKSLKKLKVLYLNGNHLNTILDSTFSGHDLTLLTLSKNNIRRLMQETFNNLTVKALDLSYNRMEIYDPEFLRPVTERLIKLDISGNRIRPATLSELIDRFPNIRDLSISNLGLIDFDPVHLQFPKSLRKLNVSNNLLFRLPSELLHPLKSLEIMDLSNNQFHGLDQQLIETFDEMKHLKVLYLHNNPWACDLCYIPALLSWLNNSKHFAHSCDVLHHFNCLKCSTPYNLSGQAIQFLDKDELEQCGFGNIPAMKVAGTDSHIGIIIACAVIVLLLVSITIILVLYYRRGADYYTHEGERDDEKIYDNPAIEEENGDLLNGGKPTIATIENLNDFKDDKYPQTSKIIC